MAIYAIGDIQGCYQQLRELLDKIHFNSDIDQLWFTGDLTNRGPQSLETLQYIYSIRDNISVVLGNHDLHLLAAAYHFQRPGKHDTFSDILESSKKDVLLDWLRQQPLIHHDKNLGFTMVHAGLHPNWSVEKASALASEIELQLQNNTNHINIYQHMYGDEPSNWSDSLEGWPRIRFILNTFTRMRYCDPSGALSLAPKGTPGTQGAGLHPWYENETRVSRNDKIIFGHWSTLDYSQDTYTKHNVFPIDTGCLWGGKLTAMRIDVQPFERITLDCPTSQKPEL